MEDTLRIFLLRFLKKNYPQVVVSNLGNVQAPAYYFKGNFVNRLRNIFHRKIPYLFFTLLSNFNLVSKIDLRFISNKKIYEKNNNQGIISKLSYFKIRVSRWYFLEEKNKKAKNI